MTAPPPPLGLCADCRHAETLASKRSTFLRCRLADTDPRFPRYPLLPVLACAGYELRESARAPDDERADEPGVS